MSTFAELKLPDLNLTSWNGLAAPARTPNAIVQQLYHATRKIMAEPDTKAAWIEKGMIVPEDITPQAYTQETIERIKFYQRVAKEYHVTME